MRLFLTMCFIGLLFGLCAQKPINTSLQADELSCNEAGTFQFLPFIGQSNDGFVPRIFLCRDDSVGIRHNGDFVINNDPDPTTPSGIAYTIYDCVPTVEGPSAKAIKNDPCLIKNSTDLPYAFKGTPNGDVVIKNSGTINHNSDFGGGHPPLPVNVWIAPITLHNFDGIDYWDGLDDCVDVNVDEAFEVVFLNPVGIRNVLANNCVGTFRPTGGMFEFDNSTTYDIEITNTTDPTAKVNFLNQFNPGATGAPLYYSVEQPGVYQIKVEDGKSCSAVVEVDMNSCDLSQSVGLSFADSSLAVGQSIAVPLKVESTQAIESLQFSIGFDETMLSYVGVTDDFSDNVVNLNEAKIHLGMLGVLLYPPVGPSLDLQASDTLFYVHFNVIGAIGACSPIEILNYPTSIAAIPPNAGNILLGILLKNGSVCIAETVGTDQFQTDIDFSIYPNPAGDFTTVQFGKAFQGRISIVDAKGTVFFEKKVSLAQQQVALKTEQLPSGFYFIKIQDTMGRVSIEKLEIRR